MLESHLSSAPQRQRHQVTSYLLLRTSTSGPGGGSIAALASAQVPPQLHGPPSSDTRQVRHESVTRPPLQRPPFVRSSLSNSLLISSDTAFRCEMWLQRGAGAAAAAAAAEEAPAEAAPADVVAAAVAAPAGLGTLSPASVVCTRSADDNIRLHPM